MKNFYQKRIGLTAIVFVMCFSLNAQDNYENIIDTTYIGNNDSSIFYISNSPLTWDASNELSSQVNGHLATITSQEENDFIVSLISEYQIHAFWLGATDQNDTNIFEWVTGEDFSYQNWNTNEPSSAPVEPYLNIWGADANQNEVLGTWNDYDNDGWSGLPSGNPGHTDHIKPEIIDHSIVVNLNCLKL